MSHGKTRWVGEVKPQWVMLLTLLHIPHNHLGLYLLCTRVGLKSLFFFKVVLLLWRVWNHLDWMASNVSNSLSGSSHYQQTGIHLLSQFIFTPTAKPQGKLKVILLSLTPFPHCPAEDSAAPLQKYLNCKNHQCLLFTRKWGHSWLLAIKLGWLVLSTSSIHYSPSASPWW